MARYDWTVNEAIGYAWVTVQNFCDVYHDSKCDICEDVILALRKHVENG